MTFIWEELKRFGTFLQLTLKFWGDARSSLMAAALAYYTMLSLSPILVLAVVIAGFVFGDALAQSTLLTQIGELTSPEIEQTARTVLQNSTQTNSSIIASLISLAVLFFGASGVFVQLHDTMNAIWGVPIDNRSGLWYTLRQRLVGLFMVLVIGLLLLSSIALSAAISIISGFFSDRLPAIIPVLQIAQSGFAYLLTPIAIMALFRYLPDRRVKWQDVWLGGIVTALLLVLSRTGIGLYLQTSTVSSAYGAAGSVVIFLIWVYFSGMILFLGAGLSRAFAKTYGSLREIE